VQSTLLGIAIALILALVAALVGPFFVDWNRYRDALAAEATRLVGVDVRVRGTVDVRLLPSPSLTLHGIELGRAGAEKLRARSLAIEFALGALVRGQLRAVEMRVGGPELNLGIGPSGQIDWPQASMGFDPDALSIERLALEDGRAVLTDAASGARTVLDKLWFIGDVRSLAGPFKGRRGRRHPAAGRHRSVGPAAVHGGGRHAVARARGAALRRQCGAGPARRPRARQRPHADAGAVAADRAGESRFRRCLVRATRFPVRAGRARAEARRHGGIQIRRAAAD
jgi:hypothetical protein